MIGDHRIRGELRRQEERFHLERVRRRACRHRRVKAPPHVDDLAGGRMLGKQAVGRPGASITTGSVRRAVLLVREDGVGGEKVD